jgi:hypothetical protein
MTQDRKKNEEPPRYGRLEKGRCEASSSSSKENFQGLVGLSCVSNNPANEGPGVWDCLTREWERRKAGQKKKKEKSCTPLHAAAADQKHLIPGW